MISYQSDGKVGIVIVGDVGMACVNMRARHVRGGLGPPWVRAVLEQGGPSVQHIPEEIEATAA